MPTESAPPPVSAALALAMRRAQPGIFAPPAAHALSIELRIAEDADSGATPAPEALYDCVRALRVDGAALVAGIGPRLMQSLGPLPPGLRAMTPIGRGASGFVATQQDLWLLIAADTAGDAFDAARELIAALAPCLAPVEATALFRYRDGRDLTGFRDGTENPQGDAAAAAALLDCATHCGGSFALVQRFVHDHASFSRLPVDHQSLVIGRERESDEEIDAAPAAAHVKRTAQEAFEPAAFLWRRSMPWGTPLRHGLQFIAFMREIDRGDRMLRRMAGADDGIGDALLSFTRAQTGSYYYCPPVRDGRLDLDPA